MPTYSGTEELLLIEECLNNYNRDVVSKLSEFLKSKKVFEFGAGIGTLAKILKEQNGITPDCLEIDKELREVVIKRGFDCYDSLANITKKYDGIYTSNVLEHIEDDVVVLKKLNSLLNLNGLIAIYVPAFMILYSGLDVSVGHVRRYEKVEMVQKLGQANFEILKCHFSDSLGFFASLLLRVFGYKKSQKNFYFYDKYVYPVSSLFDRIGVKYLFGKNLLIIAQKIDHV